MRIGVVIIVLDSLGVLRLQLTHTGRLDVDQVVSGSLRLLGRSLAVACTIHRHV